MRSFTVAGLVIGSVLQLVSCGGGGGGGDTTASPTPSLATEVPAAPPPTPSSPPAPASTQPEWMRYFGAHYTLTPDNTGTRDWAGGGLRNPGGIRTSYEIAADDSGGYTDTALLEFTNMALPVIDELLADDSYAVLKVGGVASDITALFLDSMDSAAGRDTFRLALHNRIEAIRALPHADDWEQKVYFQFGNEIQNPEVFYGFVCNWATNNVTNDCDLETQFLPAYVERYLAPGVAYLEEKSQALFGRPDAIRMVLGSVVNLSNRETFINTLLNYQVQGDYAPSMAGKYVYQLVDTVSIHYSVGDPDWRTSLDDFRNTYVPGGVPTGRVHRIWATEEVGANSAEQGYGMAAALRGIARYLDWWQANNISPDDGHMFVWGAGINSPDDGVCTGCTSVDEDMPLLTGFTGNRALLAQTGNRSTLTASANVEMHEFAVEGVDKRVVILFPADSQNATLSTVSLKLSGWDGKSVTISAYNYAAQGAVPVSVTPISSTVGAQPLDVSLSVTLDGHDAVLLLIEGSS